MTINEEQKALILREYPTTPDLIELTRKTFNDETLKGSSKEGRAIRDFLISQDLEYQTTRPKRKKKIKLTDEQKEFVETHLEEGMSSFQIAELIFPTKEIKKLGLEQRAVLAHIKGINPDYVPKNESGILTTYFPPRNPARIVKKINNATSLDLDFSKMSRQYVVCVDKLGKNLGNSRFVTIVNGYTNAADKQLFEEEFVRMTWDKPDLTADEINLYMNCCMEIIKLSQVGKQINKLNDLFDSADNTEDMTIRLSEIIKTKSTEYNQCAGRIESLIGNLQGKRSDRMKNKQKANASILALVAAFQDKEERDNMLKIAEMQKALVKEEAERLEGMDEMKARILGIGQSEVI